MVPDGERSHFAAGGGYALLILYAMKPLFTTSRTSSPRSTPISYSSIHALHYHLPGSRECCSPCAVPHVCEALCASNGQHADSVIMHSLPAQAREEAGYDLYARAFDDELVARTLGTHGSIGGKGGPRQTGSLPHKPPMDSPSRRELAETRIFARVPARVRPVSFEDRTRQIMESAKIRRLKRGVPDDAHLLSRHWDPTYKRGDLLARFAPDFAEHMDALRNHRGGTLANPNGKKSHKRELVEALLARGHDYRAEELLRRRGLADVLEVRDDAHLLSRDWEPIYKRGYGDLWTRTGLDELD